MRDATQRLTGQITIAADMSGFANYDALLTELQELPQVEAATTIIRGYGLINLNNRVSTVEVVGIDSKGLDAVTGYRDTLYWTSQHLLDDLIRNLPPLSKCPRDNDRNTNRLNNTRSALICVNSAWRSRYQQPPNGRPVLPGIVLGIEVNPYNQRDSKGNTELSTSSLNAELTLTVLPVTRRGTLMEPAVRRMVVANEFKSGLYDVDANRVYVPFEVLQTMLKMDSAQMADPETGLPTGDMTAARAGEIMLRGKPTVELHQLHEVVSSAVNDFVTTHPTTGPLWVQTWQQRHATLLGAVEKEKFLLTILFGIISVVAVAMIGVIFYMIVLEKTRDIGILRAIGASSDGVMSIFLGYGLAIGCVGAFSGLAAAAAVVYHINEIQEFLTRHFHFTMWDPSVYYFDKVPSQLNPTEVTVIVIAAILSSVLGSVLPAYLAGRVDPVESLRYE